MSLAEKIGVLIVGVAMATTLTLPKRQTPAVVNAVGNLFQGSLATSMGLAIPSGSVPVAG